MNELLGLSVEEAAAALRARRTSAVELVEACLERIAQVEPALNAFITVDRGGALAVARERDRELAGGTDRGPLHGIPIALKDLYETKGLRTTAGSRILADHVPAEDAEPVRRLRAAGAVVLGKTNLHEWAFGVTNDNPHFGAARNPYDPARIPGGSSGGSAIALATGECFASLGTDTGGSIRIPASLCGIVGLKPTYGRVSLRGVVPLAWTLDHAGPMTRTVRDAAIVLAAIAGYDAADPGSAARPVDDYLGELEDGMRGMRLAIPRDYFPARTDPAIARAVNEAARVLEKLGATLIEVALPWAEEMPDVQRIVIGSDAAAFHRERLASREADFGRDVLERLRAGLARSGLEVATARRARERLRREMETVLDACDALVVATTPITAPLREGRDAVETAARLTALTSPFNLTGVPALSLPCGFDEAGLPIGLQLATGPWREARLLRIGRAYERETSWPTLAPLGG